MHLMNSKDGQLVRSCSHNVSSSWNKLVMSLYRDFFFWKNRILLKIYIGNAFSRQLFYILARCTITINSSTQEGIGVLQASKINICQGTYKGFSYSTFPYTQQFNMLGVAWPAFIASLPFAPTEMDNIVTTIFRYQLLELNILKLNAKGNKKAFFKWMQMLQWL